MDNQLELMLTSIGNQIEWPEPSTGFSQRVINRIAAEPVRRPLFRRFAPAFGVLAVLVAAIITFSPSTRDAVADLLGLGGVQIGFSPEERLPTPVGEDLDLGRPVSLDEAREAVDYEVLVPEVLASPTQVFLDPIVPGGMVSLVYAAKSGLPAAEGTNVGALVTQFRGDLAEDMFFQKMLAGSDVELVEVNGTEGYWITGAPHSFYFVHEDRIVEETIRLVENVLLWEQDGVTLRIETAGPKAQALEIAGSLR